jgi:hypothetical protein
MVGINWLSGTVDAPTTVSGTGAPVAAKVPMGVFVVVFGVILVAFLVWYVMNRRRGE